MVAWEKYSISYNRLQRNMNSFNVKNLAMQISDTPISVRQLEVTAFTNVKMVFEREVG